MSTNQIISDLIRSLQGLSLPSAARTNRNRRRRQRRRQRARGVVASGSTPGTMGQAMVAPLAAGKRRARRRRRAGLGASSEVARGEVTINRQEFITDVTCDSSGSVGASFVLEPMSFTWLKNLSKAFERYRWNSCQVVWRPAVGANTDGTVAVGLDWGNNGEIKLIDFGHAKHMTTDAAVTKAQILAQTPNMDMPVWQKGVFNIPSSRLQSREWYEIVGDPASKVLALDRGPGTVMYYAASGKSKTVGEIWVYYSVTLSGTRNV